jgi:hypothetical protein
MVKTEKMQNFKENVVPLESEVILVNISGPEEKTRMKHQQIGINQAKQSRYCYLVKEKGEDF